MVKHTQTTPWLYSSTNCLSVFDHFVGLACKGLRKSSKLCLNLCSRRWFWSTPNLVICLISLGLWQSNIRFGSYKLQNTICDPLWYFVILCDPLRDLVKFYNLRNVKNTHGGMLLLVPNVTFLHGCFPSILCGTNGTKSRKASYIDKSCYINTPGVSHAWIQIFSFFYSRSKKGNFENLMFYAKLRYNFSCFASCITDSMVNKFQRRI